MKNLSRATLIKLLASLIILSICVLLIYRYYQLADNKQLISKFYSLGFPALVITLPYLLIILSDTLGWKYCFSKHISSIPLDKLYLIKVATETLQISLPAGALYAEISRPFLLRKKMNIEYSESISAGIIAKMNIVVSQVIFIVCGTLIFSINFSGNATSAKLLTDPLFYISATLFTLFSILLTFLLYRKNFLIAITKILDQIKLKFVTKFLDKFRQNMIDINNLVSLFSKKNKVRFLITILFFLSTWILICFESLVILKVMGINVNILQIIIIESLVSIVRISFFLYPELLALRM